LVSLWTYGSGATSLVEDAVLEVQPLIDHSPLANVVFRVEGVVLPVLTYQISGNGVAVPDDEIIIH
jgi:hypothetical protein